MTAIIDDQLPGEATVARIALSAVCGYEFLALTTRGVPTISSLVWRMPMRQRIALTIVVGLLLMDHFVTRRFS